MQNVNLLRRYISSTRTRSFHAPTRMVVSGYLVPINLLEGEILYSAYCRPMFDVVISNSQEEIRAAAY